MTTPWKKIRIGDLGGVITGRTPPSSRPECFGTEFPFVTPSDMDGRRMATETQRYLSSEGATLLQRNMLPAGSVAVSCIGWQMGKSIMIARPSFTNQQLNSIIPREDFDARFVYYALQNKRHHLLSLGSATGVRTPILNKSAFCDLRILVPSIKLQQRIAAILSAYDDLIENNRRRIRILAEMAQALYREWFVEFRFPGHEGVRMVESSLGRIPEGWAYTSIGEVSKNYDRLRKPLSKMQRSDMTGPYPYYGAAKIFDYINGYIFDGQYLLVAEDGSVMTTDGRPVLQIATGKFWVNNHAHVLQALSPFSMPFLYFSLLNTDIVGHVTGAAQPKITQANLNRVSVVQPPASILGNFDSFASPIFDCVDVLRKKNAVLQKSRDLLLPRLISGDLDVSDLDIDTDEE